MLLSSFVYRIPAPYHLASVFVNQSKLTYRPEVDGLRAIAVISVIFYHAQMVFFGRDWFVGGYIGVDIFFVISGYLITRIILSELESTGSFSFSKFYDRRARRILPMLVLVILASLPFAWQKLLPTDFIDYAQSLIASLLFSSNFYFYFNTTEYGADSALLKPFLHTWSLGVEEQFYLLFPLFAIVAYRFFKKYSALLLILLSLASLQFSEIMLVQDRDLNFYLPFSRFWELAAGALLAYRELYLSASARKNVNELLSGLGLGLIIYSVFSFDSSTPHPSYSTIIPILGVVLVIGFASKEVLVGRLLGWKLFIWVGLISYSAYLWHFPIFAFSRMGNDFPDNVDKFFWIALTIVLSILSYRFVERPFRNKGLIGDRAFYVMLLSLSALILSFATYSILAKGFPTRLPAILQADLTEKPWTFNKDESGELCYGLYNKKDFCSFGDQDASTNLYAVGDSNIESISRSLLTKAEKAGYRTTLMNSSACYFITNSYSIWPHGAERKIPNEPCTKDFQSWRSRKISETSNNIVIIGGMLDIYLRNDGLGFASANNKSVSANLIDNVDGLIKRGNKVVLVYPYPRSDINIGKFALQKLANAASDIPSLNEKLSEMRKHTSISAEQYKDYSAWAFNLLDSIESEQVARVYPHQLFCDDVECNFLDENGLFVVDTNHPTSYMSDKITGLIFDAIERKNW